MLNERVFGTKIQENYWTNRHFKRGSDWGNLKASEEGNEWVTGYWDSRHHAHRTLLLEKISEFLPIRSILEIGCNCGPNLFILAKE